MHPISFINLAAQQARIQNELNRAIQRVLAHGQYILGAEVQSLEQELSTYSGATQTISCANGTDALSLLLMAKNVAAGDAVFVPSFTFAATAEVVAHSGAIPIFVDVLEDTFTICPDSLETAIKLSHRLNLKATGIIAVDLFGLPANYPALEKIAQAHGLWVIGDAAQSFGAKINDTHVGALCDMSTTSFFPAKPLGCYGDGGAIFLNTSDAGFIERLKSLRAHGTGKDRYDFIHIGINSRLDTLQAAILLEKLKIFDEEHQRRQEIAQFYSQQLGSLVRTPYIPAGYTHAFALYTIKCDSAERAPLLALFKQEQIPYMIYYQRPLHLQVAYKDFPQVTLNTTEKLSQEVISIPMHPYLTETELKTIVQLIEHGLR